MSLIASFAVAKQIKNVNFAAICRRLFVLPNKIERNEHDKLLLCIRLAIV